MDRIRARTVIVLIILATLGLQMIQQVPLAHKFASAQIAGDVLSLGYGASTLTPVGNLVPIYASNDQLWFQSSSVAVQITLMAGNGNFSSTVLGPTYIPSQDAVMLYQFTNSDTPGIWTLNVYSGTQSVSISIEYVGSIAALPAPTSAYALQNNQLDTRFSLQPGTDAYNIEGCLIYNSQVIQNISIPIPSNLGSGQLVVLNASSSANILIPANKINTPFTFWYQLQYPYSYSQGSSSQIVTENKTTGQSTAIYISASSSLANTTFSSLVGNQRPGRAELFGFFDSSRGISVVATQVLVLDNSSWFWLGNCAQSSPMVPGQAFASVTSLSVQAPSLPTGFIEMGDVNGIESLSITQLNFQLSRLNFRAFPGNSVPSGVSITASSDVSTSAISPYNGTIYLLSQVYPVHINYTLNLQGQPFDSGTYTVLNSSLNFIVFVTLSEVAVQVNNNGKTQSGVQVVLNGNFNHNPNVTESLVTGGGGVATFYVPQGNYTFTASLDNSTQSKSVNASGGKVTSIAFFFIPVSSSPSLLPYLEAAAIIGVIANLWVWVLRPRITFRRRSSDL